MEKTVAAFQIRRSFGKIIQDVLSRGDRYVVERPGQPVAVLVPMAVYEQWQRGRDQFFDQMEDVASRTNLSAEETTDLVAEAIAEARGNSPAS